MGKLASTLLVAAGAIWTLGTGWLAANIGLALSRAAAAPLVVKVAEAPAERWVRLEDAEPRCDTRAVSKSYTFFLAAPRGGGAPFVVQRVGDVPCEAGALEGGFVPGTFTRDFLQKRFGVNLPTDGEVRIFTEALSPGYLKAALGRMLLFLAMGFLVFIVGLRAMRRARD
ncbi:hypothetical protein [Anaeromyxobacter terrae]|uniref:hypothetical protein n=1 Tax=Anaeromyxobacter terrae TaxID=2925406 RepID=UPI001F56021F|nr:hypothetical protein [Anaeromyxobacter sp. SG22]